MRTVFLLAMLVLAVLSPNSLVRAQAPASGAACDCSLYPGNTQKTIITTICIDSVMYDVEVYYCHRVYNPLVTLSCSSTSYVNASTSFDKICFINGSVLPVGKEAKIMQAVYYLLDPLGADINSVRPLIPYCDSYPNYYCWQVTMPRCVEVANNCLKNCAITGDDICCEDLWRLCVDRATGSVTKLRIDNGSCTHPTEECNRCTTIPCGFVPGTLESCQN